MNNNQNHINQSRPHDSAIKHVSGLAEYTDDINCLLYTSPSPRD